MDPEERKILERLLQISEQNNRILRKMRRAILWGRFLHIVYWLIIIGIAVASYYYLQPYIGSLTNALNTVNKFSSFK